MRSMLQRAFVGVFVLYLVSPFRSVSIAQDYFPDVGPAAVYQRALELRSGLRVLVLSLQPGYEDLNLIAHERFDLGASVLSAYVTNGQSGESDSSGLLPTTLASRLRRESTEAVTFVGGETRFLNMPDLAAASDNRSVRLAWRADTLRWRLALLLNEFKPDLVVVCRDFGGRASAPRMSVLLGDLKEAAEQLRRPPNKLAAKERRILQPWVVARILYDDGSKKGLTVPAGTVHPFWNKTAGSMAEEAEHAFRTIAVQRKFLQSTGRRTYKVLVNNETRAVTSIDQAIVSRPLTRLKSTEDSVGIVAREIMTQALHSSSTGSKDRAATDLTTLGNTVDRLIISLRPLNQVESRMLLSWRDDIENLRNTLLGAKLFARLSEEILVERQLAYLTVDSAHGLDPSGEADLYFPGVDQGWYVNEKTEGKVPYKAGETISMISPNAVPYDLPESLYGLQRATVDNAVRVYLVQKGNTAARNITAKKDFRIRYAPRYSFEVEPPIVRAGFANSVTVRFTNHTRDGVRDTLTVADSLAQSDAEEFRSGAKESSDEVKLNLHWSPQVGEGTYVIPVVTRGKVVARFAARSFAVRTDGSKRVGLLSSYADSPTWTAIHDLGLRAEMLDLNPASTGKLSSLDVVVMDRRLLTLHPEIHQWRRALNDFVNNGGHLVILSQDAAVWNESPIIEGLKLSTSSEYDLGVLVRMDSTNTLLKSPNTIVPDDWKNWIDRRAFNTVTVSKRQATQTAVRLGKEGNPVLLTKVQGKGKVTYVDLDLGHQWMNIHPGAFRLLANLLAF